MVMKLINLNLWSGRLDSQIDQFLAKEIPDILCLQEVIDRREVGTELFLSLKDVERILRAGNIWFSPVFNFQLGSEKVDFGNAILSKSKFIHSHTFFTHKKYRPNFNWKSKIANIRNLQHVTIKQKEGDKLHILNYHGYHVAEHKNGNDITLKHCQTIAEYISKLQGEVILSGDFNLVPQSQSIKVLNKILTNLPATFHLTTTRTVLTHKKDVCDYIFVSKGIKVKSFRASEEIVSDHKALILEF